MRVLQLNMWVRRGPYADRVPLLQREVALLGAAVTALQKVELRDCQVVPSEQGLVQPSDHSGVLADLDRCSRARRRHGRAVLGRGGRAAVGPAP